MKDIIELLKRTGTDIADLFYPPRCMLCRELLSREELASHSAFCSKCVIKWYNEISLPCPTCGRPSGECICGIRLDSKHYIDSELHLAAYNTKEGIPRRLVLLMKEHDLKHLFDFMIINMSDLVTERLAVSDNTVITYVPRSDKLERWNGFDQSKLIAKGISKRTGIPLVKFFSHVGSVQQKRLDYSDRRVNAVKSYKLMEENKKYVRGREIILYDDIITTGSTITHCAHLLKSAGAAKVCALALTKNCTD